MTVVLPPSAANPRLALNDLAFFRMLPGNVTTPFAGAFPRCSRPHSHEIIQQLALIERCGSIIASSDESSSEMLS